MRFELFAEGIPTPKELRMYAESRVGLAVHRAADRLSFVGVRLEARPPHFEVACQLEAWMRGIGIATASHTDADSYVAIDRAAALLEQAVLRKRRVAEAAEAAEAAKAAEAEDRELYVPLTSD